MFVERITATHQAVSWSRCAITESPADRFGRQRSFFNGVGEHGRIRQRHSAQANHIGPSVSHNILSDVRQVFLEIAISGTHKNKILGSVSLELSDNIDLPRDTYQRVFRRLIAV